MSSKPSEGNRTPPEESYLDSTDVDYLVRMNLELLSEAWITRDRIAVLEQVLIEKGVIDATEVDDYVPDDSMDKRLESLRNVIVENVIGAPFKHNHTVESLVALGKEMAAASTR